MNSFSLEGPCEEASPLSVHMKIDCGSPSVAIIWHNKDQRAYRMCEPCADHNVRNRRGVRLVPFEEAKVTSGVPALDTVLSGGVPAEIISKVVASKPKVKDIDNHVHYTDLPFEEADKALGDHLAETIGDTFIDMEDLTPVEQWTWIAKALRVHGLKIVEA